MRIALAITVALTACSGGHPAPSCQEAVHSYYSTGCKFVDLNSGNDLTEDQFTAVCQQFLLEAKTGACRGAVDDFRTCLDGVMGPASDTTCSSCSTEQEEIITRCN